MRVEFNLTAVLIRPEDDSKIWAVWIPQLDIMTQGENAHHALGMAYDASKAVIEDALSYWKIVGEEMVSKKVVHPARWAKNAKDDEHWEAFQKYRSTEGGISATLDEVDRSGVPLIFVDMLLYAGTIGGVLFVDNEAALFGYAYVRVPGKQFRVKFKEIREGETVVTLPATSTGTLAEVIERAKDSRIGRNSHIQVTSVREIIRKGPRLKS